MTLTATQIEDAVVRGAQALAEPHATEARYNARTRVLAIRYTNGLLVSIDVRKSPFLAAHAGADLRDPYVTPGGDGLIFDHAELSVSLPGLVAELIPEDVARRKVARAMGRTASEKKAAAARANGAKGGRPRGTGTPRVA